ncbi:MAG: zinc dependent phospholipase C family protein [Clostridiales bacterium]|nr:zinc dependent phospholipase C family protein [Clostridiales bacterium]
MKSASHHAMGHLLYEALTQQGYKLDRELFVLGNLLPDYLPELILNPHFTLKCQREIHIFTEALAGQPVAAGEQLPPEYALRLGILCHYMTDYFTFAHTPEFRMGLKGHGAYEQRLDDYFRAHYTKEASALTNHTFAACDTARDVVKEVYRMKRDYRAAERTLTRDVQFAYSACLGAMTRLIAASEARRVHARAPFRFSILTAERYAFRDSVCRRRIVPRRAWCPACA